MGLVVVVVEVMVVVVEVMVVVVGSAWKSTLFGWEKLVLSKCLKWLVMSTS